MVACTEPPAELPEGKYAFLLADPAAMREVWGETQINAPLERSEAPIGINPNATRTFILNLDESTVLGEHSDGVDPHSQDQEDKTTVTLSVIVPAKTQVAAAKATPAAIKKAAPILSVATEDPPPAPAVKAKSKAVPVVAENAGNASEISMSFSRLHENYQSALLMRCADGFAKPYKWDDQLAITPGDEKFNVNLGFPSFFRIVAKTMQPYHGYVIDSPAHREFFANFNFENPPACVTAVPVKIDEKLWGILVAFGGEAAQTSEALNQAISICDKLAVSLTAAGAKAA